MYFKPMWYFPHSLDPCNPNTGNKCHFIKQRNAASATIPKTSTERMSKPAEAALEIKNGNGFTFVGATIKNSTESES
jgi:hypothetical protein